MSEKKKHKIMLGIEVILLCMIVAILGTNAASSNPPSNGVSYGKNSQTTVEGALNDLYTKANYGNATASQILKDKTALVGGKQVTGTMPNNLSGTASSVITYENSLYYRIPAGYYGGLGWGSEISATYADVASAIGLTAGKLLKGQTVLGLTGTGETSCPECPTCPTCLNTSDATATAADISSGKTAYVNGQKITGTGMKGKTYEFTNEEATVSGQTFKYGTWTGLTTNEGTSYFSITLPFTPTELLSCHIVMTGNYTTSTNGRWGANFRSRTTADVHVYMNKLANGVYASNTNSATNYTDTESDCVIDGNKLQLKFHTFKNGRAGSASMYQTVADKFYLTGAISYE
jgi:hypothetical protein